MVDYDHACRQAHYFEGNTAQLETMMMKITLDQRRLNCWRLASKFRSQSTLNGRGNSWANSERYNPTVAEHNRRQAHERSLDDEAKRSLWTLQKDNAILTADKAKNTYVIHCK